MKIRHGSLTLLLFVVLILAGVQGTRADGGAAGFHAPRAAPDAVLVAFKSQASVAARLATVRRFGLSVDPGIQSAQYARLKLGRAAGVPVDSMIARLRSDPNVRVAEPDYIVHTSTLPNDPSFPNQWGLDNTGGSGGVADADVDAPEAWDISTGSDAIVVGVIDTGVDYNHPDLRDNILRDGSGRVVGYDFANNDGDPMDDNEHGTHCAGIIGAAGNNGIGVTGVNWRVRIMPVKFMDRNGDGFVGDAIRSIDYAVAHGARVLSNSWGGNQSSQLMLEAILRARNAGILFMAAAGNGGHDGLGDDNTRLPQYPANYNALASNVISVAATSRNEVLATFSNFGATSVDIAAPGLSILSTVPGNRYALMSGTSMATPFVAGAAALALSVNPSLSMTELKDALLSGTDHPASLDGRVRSGRLNLYTTLRQITPGGSSTGFTISGTVTEGGVGIPGVTVNAGSASTTTQTGGVYTIGGLAAGTYTVSASNTGHTFSPTSREVTLGPSQTGVDFAGTTPVYSISGVVTHNGAGLSGAEVLAGGRSATTAADGSFTIPGLRAGTYSVQPRLAGFTFSPALRSVTVGPDAGGIDFATAAGYALTGRITRSGTGLEGVTVTTGKHSAVTDSTGTYTLTVPSPGTYSVRPSLAGTTFSPAYRAVPVRSSLVSGIDFAVVQVGLSRLVLRTANLAAGASTTGTVILTARAPAATTVTLSSSVPAAATVPSSVTIRAGAVSASFTISTRTSSRGSTAITATLGGVSRQAPLTVRTR